MGLQTKNYSVTGKSSGGSITYTYILRVTENSINIQQNTSNITVQAILKQNYSGTAFQDWNTGVSCSLNGKQVFSDYKKRQLEGKTEHIYYTWTGDVAHNDDGTLLLTVGGKLWQSSYASYSPPEMTIPESNANAMTLTVIPRESTIRATDGAVGSCATVVVNRKSAAFSHSIAYAFGTRSGYVSEDGSLCEDPVCFAGSVVNMALPEEFYDQLTDCAQRQCTLTCRTYSDQTLIGTKTAQFTVRADPALCAPELTGRVEEGNALAARLTGSSGKLIRYVSDAVCTVSAQGRYGATITEKRIAGIPVAEDTLTLPALEQGTILFSCTDSRGFTATCEIAVPLIPYVLLTNNATVQRTDPTSGDAMLTFQGSCWEGDFGAYENALRYEYSVNGVHMYHEPLEIGEANSYKLTESLHGLDYRTTHTVEVTVHDQLMSVTKTIRVNKGIPVFQWGENDFVFHVPVALPGLTVEGMPLAEYIRSIIQGG